MAKDYIKVKRGMVFKHNINPEVDKFNAPKITLKDGRKIDDHLQYGYRDFLVVSNDIGNNCSPLCNVVPITSQDSKPNLPTHVTLNVRGLPLTALCEHVYTIHIQELWEYAYTVSDEVMDKVSDALAVQFNLNRKIYDDSVNASFAQIESIIAGIIKQKVEEATKAKKVDAVDVEDAVLRLGEGLMTLLASAPTSSTSSIAINNLTVDKQNIEEVTNSSNSEFSDSCESEPRSSESSTVTSSTDSASSMSNSSSSKTSSYSYTGSNSTESSKPSKDFNHIVTKKDKKPSSQIDKFYSRYPDVKKSEEHAKLTVEDKKSTDNSEPTADCTSISSESESSQRRKWTVDSMREFMDDANRLSPIDMVRVYHFKDVAEYHRTKYYVKNRLSGRL